MEAPGTIAKNGEMPEDAVRWCARDELGLTLLKTDFLGYMVSERGLIGAQVPIYALSSVKMEDLAPPSDPMVISRMEMNVRDYLTWRARGNATMDVMGVTCSIGDAYLDTAILLAQTKGLLH